jgi:hypothetical protein
MVGSNLLQMNFRSGRESTSAGKGHDLEGLGENGCNNANGESHGAPFLGPPPPPPPPLTHAEMMAEMLAARCESAHAMELLAQAIGGFIRGGPGDNGGNGGGARSLEGPCSYQDFLKTRPPMFIIDGS